MIAPVVVAPRVLLRPMRPLEVLRSSFSLGYRLLPRLIAIQFSLLLVTVAAVLILPSFVVFSVQFFLSLPGYILTTTVVLLYVENADASWRQILANLNRPVLGRLWGVYWRIMARVIGAAAVAGILWFIVSWVGVQLFSTWQPGTMLGLILLVPALAIGAVALIPITAMASIAAVSENRAPRDLIGRAWDFTRKEPGKAALCVLVFVLQIAGVTALNALMIQFLNRDPTAVEEQLMTFGLGSIVAAASGEVGFVLPALWYVESRCRYEGMQLETFRE
jgi:hypothetical protein